MCQLTPPNPSVAAEEVLSWDGIMDVVPAGKTCIMGVFHTADCTGTFFGVTVTASAISACVEYLVGGKSAILRCN